MLEYFPHIANASDDNKLIKVQIKYGLAGLGLFFRLLEELCKEDTATLEYDIETLIFRLRNLKDLSAEMLEDVIENSGLFIVENNQFFNKRLLEHKSKVDEKTERLKNNRLGKTKNQKSNEVTNENQLKNNCFLNEKSNENQKKNICGDIRLDKIRLDKIRLDNNISPSSTKVDEVENEKTIDVSAEKSDPKKFETVKIKEEPKLVEAEEVSQIELDFDTFWQIYPRKVSKQDAFKSYKRARKLADAKTIYQAVQEHRKTVWAGKELQYIPHASTWLNQQRWNDEPENENDKLPFTDPLDDFSVKPSVFDEIIPTLEAIHAI